MSSFNNMAYDKDPDVIAIKEWISKEDYLPQDFDSLTIKKFLHSCDHSLERTKKCIDKFATCRANMPELFVGRDTHSKRIQKAFYIGNMATYKVDEDEIILHYLEVPNLDDYEYYDSLKTFSIQGDYWIARTDLFPKNHIIILDIKYYNFKLVTKVNVFHFQKFLMFLLEAMPIRLKKIHIVNCPSFYEKLFMLVKHALPQDIIDMMSFHTTYDTLYQQINRKDLPKEYGGDAQSIVEQQRYWIPIMERERKMFLNDNMWKADLSKKPKPNGTEETMNGSFRSLSID